MGKKPCFPTKIRLLIFKGRVHVEMKILWPSPSCHRGFSVVVVVVIYWKHLLKLDRHIRFEVSANASVQTYGLNSSPQNSNVVIIYSALRECAFHSSAKCKGRYFEECFIMKVNGTQNFKLQKGNKVVWKQTIQLCWCSVPCLLKWHSHFL